MAQQWYYASQGRQVGPILDSQLRQLVATRTLGPNDLVWQPGFTNWVPAGSVPGLFGAYQAQPPAPAPAAGPRPPSASAYPAPAPAQPRSYPDRDFFDDDFREAPRRRKKRKQSSSNTGLIVGLICGGVFLLVAVVAAVVLIIANSSGNPLIQAGNTIGDKSGNGTYRIEHLPPNPGMKPKESLMNHKQVWLNANTTVTIRVLSDFGTDVDCYLDNPGGQQVALDTSISKDCHITYRVMQSGYHTIVVDNLGNIANRCTVTYSSTP
jgi:hypothetical protein